MIFEIAGAAHLHRTAHAALSIAIDPWALGAAVCCLLLMAWWTAVQLDSRCSDCGYCPVWCRCDGHRHRESR